ncbi:MAG: hypothetical protein ABSG54_17895 [Terriglobia bacterium]
MTLTEELHSLSRQFSTLAQIAASCEQPNLFHRVEKRRSNFIRDELTYAAEIIQERARLIESPGLDFAEPAPGEAHAPKN